ncbi:hypothetical protein FF38_09014 [Lucilia cuprina]|uniref:Uncharacterized protein n=1 Tax=Lucilia cuprina TaxID=7375 RepID=A0A0L0C209_LUCCU|nr:hypothetical protein FF38_09014 [Lucilia cuprina]
MTNPHPQATADPEHHKTVNNKLFSQYKSCDQLAARSTDYLVLWFDSMTNPSKAKPRIHYKSPVYCPVGLEVLVASLCAGIAITPMWRFHKGNMPPEMGTSGQRIVSVLREHLFHGGLFHPLCKLENSLPCAPESLNDELRSQFLYMDVPVNAQALC